MNDILIGRVISLGAIAGALISATLAAVIAYLFHSNFFWVIFVAGLFAGMVVCCSLSYDWRRIDFQAMEWWLLVWR